MTKKEATEQYGKGHRIMDRARKALNKATTQKEEDAANILYKEGQALAAEAAKVITAISEAEYRAKYPPIPKGTVKFEGFVVKDSVDWKRFSKNGITASVQCPTCGIAITSIAGDYLSYPKIGEPIGIRLWCDGCSKKDEDGYEGHDAVATIMIRLE